VTEKPHNRPVAKIDYHFQDASIPPQYHRSYTISASDGKIHIVVDSYGDIVNEASYDISEQQMNALVDALEKYHIEQKSFDPEKSKCIGGTSKAIKVYSANTLIIDGIAYACGGKVDGSLSGDIDSFARILESMIPDFTNLLQKE